MRKTAVALLGCLLLTGCAASWQGQEVHYKIVSVDNSTPSEMLKLELVGEAPKGVLDQRSLTPRFKMRSEVDASVGDEVLCVVEQKKGSAFEDSNVVTLVKSCKKA